MNKSPTSTFARLRPRIHHAPDHSDCGVPYVAELSPDIAGPITQHLCEREVADGCVLVIGFVLLVVTSCSSPANKNIYVFNISLRLDDTQVRGGVLGYCRYG